MGSRVRVSYSFDFFSFSEFIRMDLGLGFVCRPLFFFFLFCFPFFLLGLNRLAMWIHSRVSLFN